MRLFSITPLLRGTFVLLLASIAHCGSSQSCPERSCPVKCATRTDAWLAFKKCPTYDDAGNRVDAGSDPTIPQSCPDTKLFRYSCPTPVVLSPECARIEGEATYDADSDQCCYHTAPAYCE